MIHAFQEHVFQKESLPMAKGLPGPMCLALAHGSGLLGLAYWGCHIGPWPIGPGPLGPAHWARPVGPGPLTGAL